VKNGERGEGVQGKKQGGCIECRVSREKKKKDYLTLWKTRTGEGMYSRGLQGKAKSRGEERGVGRANLGGTGSARRKGGETGRRGTGSALGGGVGRKKHKKLKGNPVRCLNVDQMNWTK